IQHPLGDTVTDRLRGPVVDTLPVDAVRAARHPETAPLALEEWRLTRSFSIVEVDAEKAHLVSPRRIGLAIIPEHAEELVIVGQFIRSFEFGGFTKQEVGFLTLDGHQVEG